MRTHDDGAAALSSAPGLLRANAKSPPQQYQQRFNGQKLATSNLSSVPPTPMSAYFDAEDASVDYDDHALSTSSSPPTSSSTNGVRYEYGEASSPITPLTPGTWKPRELTLLRSRTESIETQGKDEYRLPDLTTALEGLGIRGLTTGQASCAVDGRPVRSAGLRDILPIVSDLDTPHARMTSTNAPPSTQASVGPPRELRLTGSLGPTYTQRFASTATGSAGESVAPRLNLTPPMPSFRSRSPTMGSAPLTITTASRLPVRHGPAFPTSVVDRSRTTIAQTSGERTLSRHKEGGAEDKVGLTSPGGIARNNVVSSPLRQFAEPCSPSLSTEEYDGAATRRPISSSTSSANAFEYDSVTDEKRNVAPVNSADSHGTSSKHTSSLSSQSRKAPSPSPMMAFNTHIFQPSGTRPRSRSADELTSFIAARNMSNVAYSHAQHRPENEENSLQAQHSTADVSWNSSASPVSASTSQSTDLTSVASRSRNSEAFEPRSSIGAASSTSRRSTSASKPKSSGADGTRRRSSQIRSAKPCAEVPDVPSFGYMGTNTTPSAALRSLQVSPTTTVIPPQGLPDVASYSPRVQREEIHGSSHWSSGSEDEDDYRTSFKTGRKSSSRSRKGSQAAPSSSMPSSRRNTGPSSSQHSLTTLKKPSLFAGLGLRKKSVPNLHLASDVSSSASSPMPLPSDSPVTGRSDGMREFPFPSQGQSKLSLSVNSLRGGTCSTANSAAPSPLSSPIIRMDQPLVVSDPDSIVSDYAQRVRKRSQSRSRMRPVAMDFSNSAPVPAMPACNTLAQAIARSQSQPKTPKSAEPAMLSAARTSSRAPYATQPNNAAALPSSADVMPPPPNSTPMTRGNQSAPTNSPRTPFIQLTGMTFDKGSLLETIQHRGAQHLSSRVPINVGRRKPVPDLPE